MKIPKSVLLIAAGIAAYVIWKKYQQEAEIRAVYAKDTSISTWGLM